MNWLILISDVLFALVAAILGILGLSTFKAIRHLGIGKSFWIPTFVSGVFLLIGSVFRIFHEVAVELDLSLTINIDEIVHVSWLLALCILMGSIYNYSRKVKTEAHTHYYEVDSESQPRLHVREQKEKKKKLPVKPPQKKEKGISGCPHHFGYLTKIPEHASVPQECLTCPRMLECRNMSSSMHQA